MTTEQDAPTAANTTPLDTWAIVELMGHVRIAGKLTEESHFGAALGRLDVPGEDGNFTTQFFGGSSVYRITPTTEDVARAIAAHNQPEPVHRWELPAPEPEDQPRHCTECGTALRVFEDAGQSMCSRCIRERDEADEEGDAELTPMDREGVSF